jgi:hypothetical protein
MNDLLNAAFIVLVVFGAMGLGLAMAYLLAEFV